MGRIHLSVTASQYSFRFAYPLYSTKNIHSMRCRHHLSLSDTFTLTPFCRRAVIDCSTYFCPLLVGKKHHAHSTVMTRQRNARHISVPL